MSKICYVEKDFSVDHMTIIEEANAIVEEYEAAGYVLTLRQLYYQFVARALLANKQSEYKRLGSIITDARLAGLVDWEAIEDRTRNLEALGHWETPAGIVEATVEAYHVDRWATHPNRIEVWIEKDALVGVIEPVCRRWDVSYLSCRGYLSASEMWRAAQRVAGWIENEQRPVIIHMGDHDPSGIDMSRDLASRLELLSGSESGVDFAFLRIALNADQVETWGPPPNPAKVTDSRYEGYVRTYGSESWELDALDPATLSGVLETAIEAVVAVDSEAYEKALDQEKAHKAQLFAASENWGRIVEELDLE